MLSSIAISFVLGVILNFVSLFFATKVTKFEIYAQHIAIISVVSTALRFIPYIGFLLSMASIFILIKRFSNGSDVLFMFVISCFINAVISFGLISSFMKNMH
ncbi:MAG: hypothetical protein RLZZ210_233 [Pseudomonadota bacterium]|jgi:predicted PurR-regulated permease PerM